MTRVPVLVARGQSNGYEQLLPMLLRKVVPAVVLLVIAFLFGMQTKSGSMLLECNTFMSKPDTTTSTASTDRIIIRPDVKNTPVIRDSLLDLPGLSAEYVWNELLLEASHQERLSSSSQPVVLPIFEVGVYIADQCVQAARMQLQVHCVEPSPKSFARVQESVEREPSDVQKYVHLHNLAASSESNLKVPFVAAGGFMDHIGSELDEFVGGGGDVIEVSTVRLDDLVATTIAGSTMTNIEATKVSPPSSIFLLKIDVQGHELPALEGLSNSLKDHLVQFVLMEYWPSGLDSSVTDSKRNETVESNACTAATTVLELFVNHDYTIYALPPLAFPLSPERQLYMNSTYFGNNKIDTIASFCQWFYTADKLHLAGNPDSVSIGYWADILAVAPIKKDPIAAQQSPQTKLMERIMQQQQQP